MLRRFLVLFLSVLAGGACSQERAPVSATAPFDIGKPLARLTNKTLSEISGIAASAVHPELFWVHNDSGNEPKVFLINKKLEIILTCTLTGVTNRDWEDIAVGPGPTPGKSYVYVAEIGDNFAMFPFKHVYRFEEPESVSEREIEISAFDTTTFVLEDGAKDTETFLVHPVTGQMYIVSKREEPVHLYELVPATNPGDTLTARKIIQIPATQIVGGDFSADGKALLLKTYDEVLYWDIKSHVRSALSEPAQVLPYTSEPQGEAITFDRNGDGYYTISELNEGKESHLIFYRRKR